MDILADTGLWTNAWYYLSWVVPFLFVLGVVVFVHEMGHFLVARFFGVTVETFSIGFGPEIGGFYDRYGTRWRLASVPLGRLSRPEDIANADIGKQWGAGRFSLGGPQDGAVCGVEGDARLGVHKAF